MNPLLHLPRGFFHNGYIVLAPYPEGERRTYLGLDDDQWPVEGEGGFSALVKAMEIPPAETGVAASPLFEACHAYLNQCLSSSLDARLLLVTTVHKHPRVVPPLGCWTTLGFDVAEPMGCHSVVNQEVLNGAAPQMSHWKSNLNQFGLFDDLITAQRFIVERESVMAINSDGMYTNPYFEFTPVLIHRFMECTS